MTAWLSREHASGFEPITAKAREEPDRKSTVIAPRGSRNVLEWRRISERDAIDVCNADAHFVLCVDERTAPVISGSFGAKLKVVGTASEVLPLGQKWVRRESLESCIDAIERVATTGGWEGLDQRSQVIGGLVTDNEFEAHP